MPFQLQDPNEIRVLEPGTPSTAPGTPEEAEVLDAIKGPALGNEIAELRGAILSAHDAEKRSANKAIAETPELQSIAGAGVAARTAFVAYDNARKAAGADVGLSAEGRDDANARAATVRDVTLARIAENVLGTQGDALLVRYPEPGFASSPSVELVAEAQLIYTAFATKAAHTALTEATGVLRRATDPATPIGERVRWNRLLHDAHGPLVERQAIAPERFARVLQPQYAELSELIRIHLATVLQVDRHRIAADRVATARQDFRWLVNSVRQSSEWDPTFEIGAKSFDWGDSSE